MTGPSTKRLPPSEPGFAAPAHDIMQSIFGGTGSFSGATGNRGPGLYGAVVPGPFQRPAGTIEDALRQRFGFTMPAALQNAFANYLQQPTADQRANAAQLALQGGLGGASNIPGFDVLSAYGPVWQRNLSQQLATQQETGPRFASTAANQSRLLQQQGLQDFNLFAQNVLETGRQRQLQGILGYSQANLGQQQLHAGILSQLMQALFAGGLSPGITVGPSPLSQGASAVAAIAEAIGAGKGLAKG